MKRKKRPYDVNTLAALVAGTFERDKTLPNEQDLRTGWLSDVVLTKVIEPLVLGEHNDKTGCIEIARQVLARIRISGPPEAVVMVTLFALNAGRRQRLTDKRRKNLFWTAADLEKTVSALPEGPKKDRCQSLLDYNLGVLWNDLGEFGKAAEFQRQSAQKADKPHAAIDSLVEQVYRLKVALCEGGEPGLLSSFPSVLEEKFARLAEATRGSTEEIRWGELNGPAHLVEVLIWLALNNPQMEAWMKSVIEAAPKLGSGYLPYVAYMNAIKAVRSNGWAAAAEVEAAVKADSDDGRKATMLLMLLRVAKAMGKDKEARSYLRQMPKNPAVRHIRAIAERALQ